MVPESRVTSCDHSCASFPCRSSLVAACASSACRSAAKRLLPSGVEVSRMEDALRSPNCYSLLSPSQCARTDPDSYLPSSCVRPPSASMRFSSASPPSARASSEVSVHLSNRVAQCKRDPLRVGQENGMTRNEDSRTLDTFDTESALFHPSFPLSSAVRPSPRSRFRTSSPKEEDEEGEEGFFLNMLSCGGKIPPREGSSDAWVSASRFAKGHTTAVSYLSRSSVSETATTGDRYTSQKRSFSSLSPSTASSTETLCTPRLQPHASFTLPAKPARRSHSRWEGGRSFSRRDCPPSNSIVLLASPDSSLPNPVQNKSREGGSLCDTVGDSLARKSTRPAFSDGNTQLRLPFSSPSQTSSSLPSSSISSASPPCSDSTSAARTGERGRAGRETRRHRECGREETFAGEAPGVRSASSSFPGERKERIHAVPPASSVHRSQLLSVEIQQRKEQTVNAKRDKSTDTKACAHVGHRHPATRHKKTPSTWATSSASPSAADPRTRSPSFFSSASCFPSSSSAVACRVPVAAFPLSSALRSASASCTAAERQVSLETLSSSFLGAPREQKKGSVLRLGAGLVGIFQGDSSPGVSSGSSVSPSSFRSSSSPQSSGHTSASACPSPSHDCSFSIPSCSHEASPGCSCPSPIAQEKSNAHRLAAFEHPAVSVDSPKENALSAPRSLAKARSYSSSPLSPLSSLSSLPSLASLASHPSSLSSLPSRPSCPFSSLSVKESRRLQSSHSSLCEDSPTVSSSRADPPACASARRRAPGKSGLSRCASATLEPSSATSHRFFAASLVHALEKPDDDDFRLVLPPSPAALRRTQEEASSDEEEDTAEKAQEEGDGKRQDRRTSMRERLSFFRGASLRRRQTTDAHGDSAASGFSSSSLKEERADAQGKGVEGEARRDAEIAKKPSRSLLLGFGSKGGRGEKSRSGSRALDGPPPGEDPIAREDRQPETGTASVTVHQEEPTVVAASVDSGERQSNPDERDETQVSPEGRGNPFSASSDLDEPERGECASSREGQARANVHAKKGEQTPGGVKSVLKRPETSESKLGLGAPYRRSISFKHLSGSSSGDEEDRSIGGDSEDRKGERDGQRREADAPLLHRRSTVRWSELVEEKGNGGDEEEGSGGSAEHEASGPRGLRDRRKSSLFVGKATDWEEREDDSFSRATRESVAGEEGNSRGLGTADDAPQQRLAGDPHQVYRHPTGREDGAPETIPSSPSYLFTHASSLHQLLQLPPAKYFNLTAEIQRQRSIFPRRWVDETLLIHQSLLLFCASLRPLCVRIMVPLSNVQAVALLDVNLRERDRRKATKRGWRLKLLHTETSQRGKGKVQEIVCRFKQENDMHTWAERLTLLAQKWRQRPAVPDLLYRPPCQTQLDEVSRDIHKAASTLLVQRIFFACCAAARSQYRLFFFSARLYCLQKLRRESELRIQRTASAACRAAAQREGACRLQLVLEKKLRLHFWDLCQQSERIHLHTVQKKRLAVAVALLEKEEEAVARHITHWRKRSLVLILSAALARRLSWAVTQLGVATKLAAARAKQKSAGALYLEEVLRRYEQRRLRGAFAVLRRETRRRGEQGKKLKLVVDTLRKQRLAVAWQRLVQFYIASAKTQARKVEQAKGMALELSLLAVEKKRVASAFFKLKEHAHASREDEREAVCRNMEKVNETLRTAALRVPRQRGFLVLSAVVRKVQRSLLLSSFSLWTGTLRRESRKKTALVRVARVIEQKERRMKEVGLSSLFRWGHFANEQLCRKRAGASLLAASLSSISRRILGSAWGKLTIHGEDRPFERELKGVFVLEKIRRRRLQFFFTQLQREAACGRDLRVFLKSHVLHAFVHLLALRRVKILSTSFQRLRSFSSRASSQTRASSRTCLAQRPSPPPLDPLHLPQAARSLPVSPRRESFDRSKTGAREILASRSLIEGRQIAEESRETRLAEGVAVSPSSPYLLPTKRLIPLPACDPPQRSPFPSSSFSASTAPPFSSSLVFGHTDAFLPSPETEATMDRIHDLLRLSGDLLEQQEKLFSSHSEAESPPVVPRVAPVPGLATPSLSRVSGGTETESRSREETVSMDAPKKAEKRRESGKKPGGNARATEETPKKKEKKTVTRRSSASAKALGLAESGGEASRAKGCLFRTSASMDSVFLDSGNQAAGRSAVPIVPPVGILVSSASTEQLPGLLSPRSLRLPSPFNLDDAPLFACSPSPIQEDGSSSWGFAPCRAPLPLGVDDAGTRTSGPTAASPRLAVSLSGPVSFHRTGDFPSGALGNRRLLAPPSGILVFEETRETSREAPVFGFTQNPKNFRDQDREIDALIDHLQRKLGFPTETSQHSWIVDSADSNPQSFVSPSSPFFNPSVSLPFCPASASPSLYPHSGPVEQGALRVSPAVSAVRTLERPRSADTERKKGLFSVLNSLSPCASPLSRCCGFVSGESPEKKPMERPQARDSPADAAALPRKITSSASRVRFVDTTGATLEQRQGDGTCSSSASFPFCTDFSSPCSSLKSFSGFSPETQNLDTLPAGAWVPVHAASLGYAAPRVHATASQKSGKKKVSSLAKRPAVDAPAHAVDASPGVLSPGGVRGFRFARGT